MDVDVMTPPFKKAAPLSWTPPFNKHRRGSLQDAGLEDIDVQRTLAFDALMPQMLNALRNIFCTAALQAGTLRGLEQHIQQEQNLENHESEFCTTVRNILDHGIPVDNLQRCLDHHSTYSEDYKRLYKEWIMIAVLRAGYGKALLNPSAMREL